MTHQDINKAIKLVADLSLDKASESLTTLLHAKTSIKVKNVNMVDVTEVTREINTHNREVMGVVIELCGDAPFNFFMHVDVPGALTLTDLFLRQEPGTTKESNAYVEGMVQETGNIISSAICSVFAASFQVNVKPTPPDVVHDFLGTIFEEFLVSIAEAMDFIMLIQCSFEVSNKNVNCSLYLYPHVGTEKTLSFLAGAQ